MHHGNQKLHLKYFGPFPVIEVVGLVAYGLQLPLEALIHNVFHVSELKPAYAIVSASSTLPPVL